MEKLRSRRTDVIMEVVIMDISSNPGKFPVVGSDFWGVPIAAERDYSAKSAVCTGRVVAGGEFPLPGQLLLYL